MSELMNIDADIRPWCGTYYVTYPVNIEQKGNLSDIR